MTLHYCQTLIDWGDALMRRGRSPEAFQQARVLYDTAARITGPRPRTILLPEPAAAPTVAGVRPGLRAAEPPAHGSVRPGRRPAGADPPVPGRTAAPQRPARPGHALLRRRPAAPTGLAHARRTTCADEEDWCGRPSPYRFLSQIQKAIELAGRVRELGAALLAAYEKGDAEYLASIHAEQEREMLALGIAIRQDQWRDADWQVQALQQTKDVNQANLLYYASLYQNGLINNEIQNLDLTTNALQTRTGANVTEAVGEIMNIIPDSLRRGHVERRRAADRHQAGPRVRGDRAGSCRRSRTSRAPPPRWT